MLVRNFSVKSRKGRNKEEGTKKKGDVIPTAELDRRDQVTATNSWPSSFEKREQRSIHRWQHLLKRGHPTCTERPSLNQECGWKGGDRGGLAQWESFGKRDNKEEERKNERTP
jgi:hypothetical protein